MGTPTAHPGSDVPGEVVVRPDRRRYRRYFALRWVVVTLAVAALVIGGGFVWEGSGNPAWSVTAGVIFGALAAFSLCWRWRTYLDPEPALVLRPDQFRIRHKRLDLWVPWTDVASVRRYTRFAQGHFLEFLEFDLVPEARWKLPMQDARLLDQMMMWRTNDLVYHRPCDTPEIREVEQIAKHLHANALAGSRHTLEP